jgi:hypothetical protein
MRVYLEHLFYASRVRRTIFVDVGSEDHVCVFRDVSLLVGLVVAQFGEDGLGHISIEVVYENTFAHLVNNCYLNQAVSQLNTNPLVYCRPPKISVMESLSFGGPHVIIIESSTSPAGKG